MHRFVSTLRGRLGEGRIRGFGKPVPEWIDGRCESGRDLRLETKRFATGFLRPCGRR